MTNINFVISIYDYKRLQLLIIITSLLPQNVESAKNAGVVYSFCV